MNGLKLTAIITASFAAGVMVERNIPIDLSSEEVQYVTPGNIFTNEQLNEGPYKFRADGDTIHIYDNNPFGMKAFILKGDKEIPLEHKVSNNEYATFVLPKGFQDTNVEYQVKAVDRHGNKETFP